ncbi:MAG: hypothetical protein ACRDN0_35665 [Trebonia sp.]
MASSAPAAMAASEPPERRVLRQEAMPTLASRPADRSWPRASKIDTCR